MYAMAGAFAVLLAACESDSVFEGEPTVAPPVVAFDADGTAATAIHGGQLPVRVVATDAYVGIDSVVVRYSGAMTGGFTRRFGNAPRQVTIDTILPVPFGVAGDVAFEAFAMNRYRATVEPAATTSRIVQQDTIRPTVTLQAPAFPARVELRDTLRVQVQAADDQHGVGIVRAGVTVTDTEGPVTSTYALDFPSLATVDTTFRIPVAALPGQPTARVRNLTVVAWAIDAAGNCTAVGAGGAQVPCTVAGNLPVFGPLPGVAAATEVTATTTAPQAAASGDVFGDMVVDPSRRRVYLSNRANNSVDAYSWETPQFTRTDRALVGAAPLGLSANTTNSQLIVANSGGTSLSFVDMNPGNFREASRFETPNAALFELSATLELDTIGISVDGTVIVQEFWREFVLTEYSDFSDRPQYVAQDAAGVIFYSTVPTGAAPLGAMRRVEQYPGATTPEASIMLGSHVVKYNSWGPNQPPAECYGQPNAEGFIPNAYPCVIANVDSLKLVYESPLMGATWDVWDHVPGRPDLQIHVRSSSLYEIATTMRNAGSDIFMYAGSWDVEPWLSAGPNTYVTASGDRTTVNFAEQLAGRVWHWNVMTNPIPQHSRFISNFVNISDYVNNTSSPIIGASANHTGTLFATRSGNSVFFFNNPLRLLGSYEAADIAGGQGLALVPSAVGGTAAGEVTSNWAAVGGALPEIILVDTRHFRRVGRIALVEPVGGPLRAIGRQQEDPANVVGHIFGVTVSGRVFHVPVRTSDFTP